MTKILERQTFLIALTFVTGLFLFLLKPFFAPILWACIIAILFHPVQLWLKKKLGELPNLTALITLIACIFLVVIPVLLLLTSFFQQGSALYQRIENGEIQLAQYFDQIRQAFPVIQQFLERMDIDIASLQENVTAAVVGIGGFLTQNAVALGMGTFNFFTKLALMLYIAFFLLRDGRQLIEKLIRVIPMGDERERLLFQNIAGVARATVKGNLLVAIVQGMLGGLIFWILGIPSPLLWGVIMMIFSMIPVIGAGLVWAPTAMYLYTITQWFEATVLIAYGVFIIGLTDNVLRPILVGRDTRLPDWMVLLSTLGGLTLMGINGFVVGPLIAVLFVAFWQIFSEDFNADKYANQGSSAIETNTDDLIKSKSEK
jgi:predicted PurR-regulated permease PerM